MKKLTGVARSVADFNVVKS